MAGDPSQPESAAPVAPAAEQLLGLVAPPEGVRLVGTRPSRTGQGGHGVLARYSDGTTVSAMVNSDGSLCILFFRGEEPVPARRLPAGAGDLARFTW
jgi:hypothetical protein